MSITERSNVGDSHRKPRTGEGSLALKLGGEGNIHSMWTSVSAIWVDLGKVDGLCFFPHSNTRSIYRLSSSGLFGDSEVFQTQWLMFPDMSEKVLHMKAATIFWDDQMKTKHLESVECFLMKSGQHRGYSNFSPVFFIRTAGQLPSSFGTARPRLVCRHQKGGVEVFGRETSPTARGFSGSH